MITETPATVLPTVSRALIEDWLQTLRAHCPAAQLGAFLRETSLDGPSSHDARATHDQIVRLYQLVALETGDEMMGLWSRPIRSGALKNLCVFTRDASSLGSALHRFATFWNLLLDDFELVFSGDDRSIALEPRAAAPAHRFGHMLLLKLAHGVASWLAGRELRVREVDFAFARPSFAEDYAVLFPAPVRFGWPRSSIAFDEDLSPPPLARTDAETLDFLKRAPRDWIYTSYREHTLALRIREMILASDSACLGLNEAAQMRNMTPRTLIRRLKAQGATFQSIKDGLRRDIALRELQLGHKSIEAISQDLGFASAANFHRAFKKWTGATPRAFSRR